MTRIGNPRKARARNIALFAVLLIAAVGLFYRMLRPFWEELPTSTSNDEPTSAETEAVDLLRVVDGDTIEVRWRNENARVRLLRINTPERGARGYDEASRALESLLRDRELRLEFERPGHPARDKYDRLLAYVLAGGSNINAEMVRLGWTRFWTRYGAGRHANLLAEAEREARTEGAGLWRSTGWNKTGE
ncbi:MAG: thermonuclease family protein [Deltaproteobacteria bacterium]|nr:thermonuclease family protein [Deltaproteobacteria bacterium]